MHQKIENPSVSQKVWNKSGSLGVSIRSKLAASLDASVREKILTVYGLVDS